MDLTFIWSTLLALLPGIPLTCQLAAVSIAIGALVGLGIALLRLSSIALLSSFAWLYVQVVRSVPLLVLLFLTYYGLGQFEAVRNSGLWPFLRDPYWCALIALVINTSAYASEIIRGGLQSVPQGDIEAAHACGMSRWLTLRRIVLPVAARQALPGYGNEMIAMIKATSLVSLVTLMDVTGIASTIASETYRPVEVFIAAGFVYLTINFILTRIVMGLEHWLTPHFRDLSKSSHSEVQKNIP